MKTIMMGMNEWLCEPSHKLVLIITYQMSNKFLFDFIFERKNVRALKRWSDIFFVISDKILVRIFRPTVY